MRGSRGGLVNGDACTRGQRRSAGLAAGLLLVHAVLVGWIALRTSPTLDEVGHLPAGLYSWRFGRFDVYRVNPPLVRTWAALPVVLSGPELRWSKYADGPSIRPEWNLGREFIAANDRGERRWLWYFVIARWMCIPLSVIGGYVCWRWAGELYGPAAGLLALTLWCFCPNVLAWAATIGPDAGAAAMGVAAAYLYWRWLREPTWAGAVAAGAGLGLALLTKTTWIVLFAVWPVLWVLWWSGGRKGSGVVFGESVLHVVGRRPKTTPDPVDLGRATQLTNATGTNGMNSVLRAWLATGGQLAVVLLGAVYVLNLGYGFEGSFKPLGQYTFVSRTLAGEDSVPDGGMGGNRFTGTWLGAVPVPVPENFLRGIDLQKSDFEETKRSFLWGHWKQGGWWYYYLVAALLKVPLGTWVLGAMAVGCTLSAWGGRGYGAGWRSEWTLLLPALAVFVLVSSQTGFSRYFRYVLPCFPFVYIWISKVVCSVQWKDWWIAGLAGAALLWSVGSSLCIYPHSLSYFNELAGGPRHGHRYLLDANIDWGQDLGYLKRWLDANPDVSLVHLDWLGFIPAKHFGIEVADRPPRRGADERSPSTADAGRGPEPGWYAISVHRLFDAGDRYRAFQQRQPTATAGYSIYIYHVKSDPQQE